MVEQVRVLVLRTAGTNCDQETAFAFQSFGAKVDRIHINRLFDGDVKLEDYHILALPGGFSYGDDIEAGRVLANELRIRLGNDINRFVEGGKLIIGICNGFQVLVKAGILPGSLTDDMKEKQNSPVTATLMTNDSAKFEDRWVYLKISGNSPWLKGIKDIVYFPVAHAEGKFVPSDKQVLNRLKENNQIAFRYCSGEGAAVKYPSNPNGSVDDIAGITDRTGRILGLMPHPERHFLFVHHPFWTRLPRNSQHGDGAKIFENGIKYVQENLLNVKCEV
jgi:phosphoribosylformylglycinamidine synthase